MKPFCAVGVRLPAPSGPERTATEAADLSSFSRRDAGGIEPEALSVAPPREFWTSLAGPVPGRLIEGSLPRDPEARYALSIPAAWNGGLAVSASPGLLGERSLDLYWADFLLSRGYAFACTDKGARLRVCGDRLYIPVGPENAMRLWPGRLKALAELSRRELDRLHGRPPDRSFAVGVSNGGFLVRKALEDIPELFDGGVEVAGVLWRADRPGLLDRLPAALRGKPVLPVPPGAEGLLTAYREFYWPLVLACLLAEFDPEFAGAPEGYDLARRPAVLERVREIENTGRLERPLISICGGLDFLVPAREHAEGYAELAASAGRSSLHRLIRVERGSHVDQDRDRFPFVEPLLPHAHAAFAELERLVTRGVPA